MTTLSERIVEKIAIGWRAGSSRRSFLSGAAVVGTALASNPWRYLTRPMTAYASVCGEGAACNEGWSAFCCTVTGANQCPPGSFVAGWWKADQSGFCCGSARYYVDCNAACGSDWTCHCASGSCDQRRVACNQFRYGQCHQEIACYGPVVCRVVTCTPPWIFDDSCTATSLTDNRTVTHSAPCLPGNCPSTITQYYYDHGGPGGTFGPATSAERAGADGGRFAAFSSGVLYTTSGGGVRALTGTVFTRYKAAGGPTGALGYPTGVPTAVTGGLAVPFQHGSIYRGANGKSYSVSGAVGEKWRAIGKLGSGLGLPIAQSLKTSDGNIRQKFTGGAIFISPAHGAHVVKGSIFRKWIDLGGSGGVLGVPIADQAVRAGFQATKFTKGTIYSAEATGTRAVTGTLYTAYRAAGGTGGALGLPVEDEVRTPGGSRSQRFQRGGLFWTAHSGSHPLTGVYWAKWRAIKGTVSGLGFPTSGQVSPRKGQTRITFTHGAMYHSAATGVHYLTGRLHQEYARLGGSVGSLGLPTSDPVTSGSKITVTFVHGSLVLDTTTNTIVRKS
ncbi:hypothetical protein D1871_16880 [Nakamurella silvestris]|nr:hypothetical protein D1871_16880 [Nakamurella silvestris]